MVQELASWLDAAAADGRAQVGETAARLTAYGLSAADVTALAGLAAAADGWATAIEDGEGNPFAVADLHPDFAPYRISLVKPAAPAGVLRLVSLSGFTEWLERPTADAEVQVAACGQAWTTRGVRFGPWAEPAGWAPDPEPVLVRRVVRETASAPCLPEDLRPWLLKDATAGDLADPAFTLWAAVSARHLTRSVANEVETPTRLLFRGPPVLRLEITDDLMADLGAEGFRRLQAAAIWIFDSARELDTRHGFFAAEVPRSAPARAVAGPVLAQAAESALEGAKIAYQLHLSQVSRDSLKAMADLRKAVADETGKLADSTRTVVGAVAAAALGGVGLIAARLTLKAPQWPAVLLALVLSLHVVAVIWAGWRFLEVQRSLRSSWRTRLYAFLTDPDFKALVSDPVGQAEGAFWRTALLGGIAAALLLGAAVLLPRQLP